MTTQIETNPSSTVKVSTQTPEQQMIEARRLAAWERDRTQINDFFNSPMKYISAFWQEYKPIVSVIGAIVLALLALKVTLGVIGFITGLPLVGGLLELVGIGYTVWFVNRYLLKAETRQELSYKLEDVKQDVIGATKPVADEFKQAINPE